MSDLRHLWAIGYDDMGRANQVRAEITKLGWDKHALILEDVMVVARHPDGSFTLDREFEALFTPDRPVILNFHGYPWLIHRLTYRRPGQHHIHVRGYKEQGNINTPLELAIRNQTDRFSLAIDAIDRMPRFRITGARGREALLNQQIACKQHAYESGTDPDDINNWEWPF